MWRKEIVICLNSVLNKASYQTALRSGKSQLLVGCVSLSLVAPPTWEEGTAVVECSRICPRLVKTSMGPHKRPVLRKHKAPIHCPQLSAEQAQKNYFLENNLWHFLLLFSQIHSLAQLKMPPVPASGGNCRSTKRSGCQKLATRTAKNARVGDKGEMGKMHV